MKKFFALVLVGAVALNFAPQNVFAAARTHEVTAIKAQATALLQIINDVQGGDPSHVIGKLARAGFTTTTPADAVSLLQRLGGELAPITGASDAETNDLKIAHLVKKISVVKKGSTSTIALVTVVGAVTAAILVADQLGYIGEAGKLDLHTVAYDKLIALWAWVSSFRTPTPADAPKLEQEVCTLGDKPAFFPNCTLSDAPIVEEVAPIVEEVAPIVEEVAPIVEEVAPIVEVLDQVVPATAVVQAVPEVPMVTFTKWVDGAWKSLTMTVEDARSSISASDRITLESIEALRAAGINIEGVKRSIRAVTDNFGGISFLTGLSIQS